MASAQDNLSEAMWQSFVSNLNSNLTPSPNPALTPKSYIPTSGQSAANWELLNTTGTVSGTPGTIIVNNLESWCNNMPVWGPSYLPGSNFYDNYSLFLYSLKLGKPGDPAQQQIADLWAKKVQDSQAKINQYRIDSANAWTVFDAGQKDSPNKVSYTDWYNTSSEGPNKPGAPSWRTTIENEEKVKADALENYEATLVKVGGEGFDELNAATKAVKLSASNDNIITDSSGAVWPKYSISPGLNDWFQQALANSDKPPQISFEIDLKSVTYDASETSEFLSTGSAPFATSGSGSNQKDHTELIQQMTMNYQAQSANIFTFTPGTWFDSNFMSAFPNKNADGTYIVSPQSTLYGKDLFGPNGIINLRTFQVLVIYRSKLILKGDTSQVNALNQAAISGGSFSIAGSNIQASDIKTDSTDITMQSNSNTPDVIGIIPQKFG